MNPAQNNKQGMNTMNKVLCGENSLSYKVKKIMILFSVLFLFGFTPTAFAQQPQQHCDSLQPCPSGQTCSSIEGGVCVTNSSLTNQVTGATAGPTATQPSSGSGFTALAPIPGLTDQSSTSVINSTSLALFFNNLYKYLIGLAAVLAVIMIIWGGLEYSTQDSISGKGAGKERIQQAIFGLVLVLSPYLVFSIINPSILNLSLNLPPINLSSTPYTPPSSSATIDTPLTTTGPSSTINDSYMLCLKNPAGDYDCSGAVTTCQSSYPSTSISYVCYDLGTHTIYPSSTLIQNGNSYGCLGSPTHNSSLDGVAIQCLSVSFSGPKQ